MGFKHSYVKFSTIYITKAINNYKLYKVADEQIMEYPGLYREYVRTKRSGNCFLSPVLLKGLVTNEFTIKHDSFKSDVFSFAMIILQLLLNSPSD